jgi:hypothetical protein
MENLLKAVTTIIKTAESVDKALQDSKVTPIEGIQIGITVVPWIGIFKNFDKIMADMKQWNDTSLEQTIQYVRDELQLSNPATEQIVEQAVEILFRFAYVVIAPSQGLARVDAPCVEKTA